MTGTTRQQAGTSTLGRCPGCDAPIPAARLLIEYRTAEGWPRMYAECPSCASVVHPR
jgi:hypothetical protein